MLPMRRLVMAVVIAVTGVACGGSSNDGQSPPPNSGGNSIRGNERLGWDQQAASSAELAALRYAIYVDGVRSEVADVNCSSTGAAAGFPCSGRLPAMSPGTHTLELAAFRMQNGAVSESTRSAPLVVTLSGTTAVNADAVDSEGPSQSREPKAARVDSPLALSPLADGFDDISDLALVRSRLLLVAERRGVMHAIDLEREIQIESLVFDGTAAAGESGTLWSLAVDPAFDSNGLVYALQTGPARNGDRVWQVVRYRRVATRFGERAVVAELPYEPGPASPGVIRLSPDGTLNIAVSTARRPVRERAGGSVLLRLNPDGTTPRDQPGGNPERGAFSGTARGIDWDAEAGIAWAVHASAGTTRLVALGDDQRLARAGLHDQDYELTGVANAASLAFYSGDRLADLHRNILVAGTNGLYGIRVDRTGRPEREPRRLGDVPLTAVHVTAAGELVLGTATGVFLARTR
ncbi:MAG TPA: PQQ-dependent sugar dehydrogenase [Vicinamibacterales bacterium]|nr:PQQ-dependent sugar dehydrogenase [Vicinamibacterales bacterium]